MTQAPIYKKYVLRCNHKAIVTGECAFCKKYIRFGKVDVRGKEKEEKLNYWIHKGDRTMTQARYNRIVSLTEEENNKVEELKKKGVKVIEIFRAGLVKLGGGK